MRHEVSAYHVMTTACFVDLIGTKNVKFGFGGPIQEINEEGSVVCVLGLLLLCASKCSNILAPRLRGAKQKPEAPRSAEPVDFGPECTC